MSERVIVTLHLPLDATTVARVCTAVARDYPDAMTDPGPPEDEFRLVADPDLLPAERRAIARQRRAV